MTSSVRRARILVLNKELIFKGFSDNFRDSLYLRAKVICFESGFSTIKETCTPEGLGLTTNWLSTFILFTFFFHF